jgi:hypothetical protein
MTHTTTSPRFPWLNKVESVLGHLAMVMIGFVMMVIGLALGVTMIMLPVGLVVGFAGVGLFIAGLFGHFGSDR